MFCGNYEMLFYGNYMILIVWDIWERKEYLGKCEVWFIIGWECDKVYMIMYYFVIFVKRGKIY